MLFLERKRTNSYGRERQESNMQNNKRPKIIQKWMKILRTNRKEKEGGKAEENKKISLYSEKYETDF